MISIMRKYTGWVILPIFWAGLVSAQTLNNQTVAGRFFFRHVSLGTDGVNPGNLTDPRSLIGSVTFDGTGRYSYIAQLSVGVTAPVSQTGAGAYAVDAGGFVTLDSPLRTGAKINARYGSEALLGSSTESPDNTYDLFVAVPAPGAGASVVLGGPYTTVSLEFPGGATTNMRNTQFSLNVVSPGFLSAIAVNGHATNLAQGRPTTQQVTGANYTMNADGTGTISFGTASNAQLLSGNRTLYLSATGNTVLGGSPGGHDILMGVKALTGASNATWNGTFWGAGLRVDLAAVSGYSGAVAARGQGKLTLTRRVKALGVGLFDFTGINGYTLGADGTGTAELTTVGLGAGGKAFVGSAIHQNDPGAYEVYFGVQVASLSGTGVFLNPLGVVNAASSAPPGNPIAPGQFISLYGTGLAKSTQTGTPPYPATLNGVTVLINNKAAPLHFVSAGQINALVPYSTTGATATIVVQNSGANSNPVMVAVAATAPGVYSLDGSGSGGGSILHADFGLVNAARPAAPGETVLVYLTGMGAVNPTVADGTAGTAGQLYRATADAFVLVAGKQATVAFNGLAPGFPGLYQLNVTLPSFLAASGNLPLAIQTSNAYHDQVDIPVR
jgi:trimeric autotransporter adhesin